jgi:hypothetical protein
MEALASISRNFTGDRIDPAMDFVVVFTDIGGGPGILEENEEYRWCRFVEEGMTRGTIVASEDFRVCAASCST